MTEHHAWTVSRELALREAWESETPTDQVVSEFNAMFGSSFTVAAISWRASKIGARRPDSVRKAAASKGGAQHGVWRHPDALPTMERLWTTTDTPPRQIAEHLNAMFQMAMTGHRVSDHARKRGFERPTDQRKQAVARPETPAGPVRLVAPGSFPANRFSMLNGRIL